MNRVYEFNKVRNGFAFNEENEVKMLQEEITEFYEAKTLAERIDAMIDVRYVYHGTAMKANAHFLAIPESIITVMAEFKELSGNIVNTELGEHAKYLPKIMDKSWDIVCDINALKTKDLDENGKVIKPTNLPNATHQIVELLDTVLGSDA